MTGWSAQFQHELAAIGEGCCPRCHRRLEPYDTPKGTGGRCCGIWHADPQDPTGWEAVCWWADDAAMARYRPHRDAR